MHFPQEILLAIKQQNNAHNKRTESIIRTFREKCLSVHNTTYTKIIISRTILLQHLYRM